MELTQKEKEVMEHLTNQYKSVKQSIQLLKISKTRYYQILRNLKKKGEIRGSAGLGWNKATHCLTPPLYSPCTLPMEKLRLHGQEFNIKLGVSLKQVGLVTSFDNNTIQFFKNSFNVYCAKDKYFYGANPDECLSKSIQYFNSLFYRLEDFLKIRFYTSQKGEIKQVAAHFEEWNSEFAKYVETKTDIDKLSIKGSDSKTWLKLDKSLNGQNTEVLHPKTAKEDAELIFTDVFNSLKDHTAFTPKEATDAIGQLATLMAQGQNRLNAEIITHLGLLRQEIKDFKKNPKKDKSIQGGLSRWL